MSWRVSPQPDTKMIEKFCFANPSRFAPLYSTHPIPFPRAPSLVSSRVRVSQLIPIFHVYSLTLDLACSHSPSEEKHSGDRWLYTYGYNKIAVRRIPAVRKDALAYFYLRLPATLTSAITLRRSPGKLLLPSAPRENTLYKVKRAEGPWYTLCMKFHEPAEV